ncbi:MAG TPA: hybrid sensor histidine kinase/response regulator, partial [Gammaproteobacteria bacterium]|nr:hybrid sensor histidine kinase/response regulator [Gammaproteobacteria bacterium]
MALDVKKFLGRFVGEARDHVARLESGLTALENGAADGEAINALFRSAHTIKGSSRMLKLASITDTAHQLEEVLGALREGRIVHTPELGSLLMRAVDAILALVEQVEQVESIGTELPPPDHVLCEALSRAAVGASTPPPNSLPPGDGESEGKPSAPAGVATPPADEQTLQAKSLAPPVGQGQGGGNTADTTVRVRLGKLDDLVKLMGEVVSNQVKLRQRALEARTLDRALQSLLTVCSAGPEFAESALVLHRFAETLRDDVQEQERLTGRLSDQALIMRMLPLSQVFDPAARMARELARSLGKDVRCEVGGGEIELDRQMIDRLNDVLTHLLRNAVDHGLESTEERRAAGKSPISRLSLTARQEGAGVVVEIADDGQGLNREKILAKAMQKGLIDPGHSAALTDDQVAELIFQPGLSTSAIITDLSGRGVGMDVVKRTIVDELHGAISVASRQGGGTVFAFKLPLSLAMMRVLLFQAADQVLGLAAHHVVELVRVAAGETLTVVGRPALVLRNEFVPLIPLTELLGQAAAENTEDERLLVVVIGVNQAKLGLVIDRLLDERDMVIKPLPEHLR